MNRYELRVLPHGALFLGGYSAAEGKGANVTARDHRGFLAPGSALRGALRETCLRLLRGAGRDDELVIRLFGDKANLRAGKVRLGPLYAVGDAAQMATAVRHHVSLERTTRAAANQRLFSTRVTPTVDGLVLRGELEILEALDDDEWDLLRTAIDLTDQLGGGRGRGLGLVQVELGDAITDETSVAGELTSTVQALESILETHGHYERDLLLTFEVLEPLQLGAVKEPGNIERTVEVLHGSTVRGAVAAAMGRTLTDPAERREVLEQVFGGHRPVVFGDGLPTADGVIAPLTLLEAKDGKSVEDRAVDLYLQDMKLPPSPRPEHAKSAKGCWTRGGNGWYATGLPRRLVTHSARNAIDGRSQDGLLYSIEVIDPSFEGVAPTDAPLCFHLPVRGPADSLRRVVEASRQGLLVGGTRGRGFGRIALQRVSEPTLPTLTQRHLRWVDALMRRGVPEDGARRSAVLLATGFLAIHQPRLKNALDNLGLELRGGTSRRQAHSGWNSRVNLPRTLVGGFVAGSVFLVNSRRDNIFDALLELEERGLGPGRADGWGRLIACHPIHIDCLAGDAYRPHPERS